MKEREKTMSKTFKERRERIVGISKLKKPKRLKKIIKAFSIQNLQLRLDAGSLKVIKDLYIELIKYLMLKNGKEDFLIDIEELKTVKDFDLLLLPPDDENKCKKIVAKIVKNEQKK